MYIIDWLYPSLQPYSPLCARLEDQPWPDTTDAPAVAVSIGYHRTHDGEKTTSEQRLSEHLMTPYQPSNRYQSEPPHRRPLTHLSVRKICSSRWRIPSRYQILCQCFHLCRLLTRLSAPKICSNPLLFRLRPPMWPSRVPLYLRTMIRCCALKHAGAESKYTFVDAAMDANCWHNSVLRKHVAFDAGIATGTPKYAIHSPHCEYTCPLPSYAIFNVVLCAHDRDASPWLIHHCAGLIFLLAFKMYTTHWWAHIVIIGDHVDWSRMNCRSWPNHWSSRENNKLPITGLTANFSHQAIGGGLLTTILIDFPRVFFLSELTLSSTQISAKSCGLRSLKNIPTKAERWRGVP